ncbi:DNA-binding response regulator [Chitinophaga silvatica]|uniref:DNA-binding response regulator n=1 Tax=Chitinophaga silvatica TaxID=2282649 RepID=A0A3E1YGX5_9BACT|nr:response regulator [Chitinophaga silvatica]RFS26675.1 DNA-binding response regulator [Chitinophaga silvatica]
MEGISEILKKTKSSILIIDDSDDILDYLSHDLGKEYKVHTAKNGEAALALLQQEFVQLVVSDVMMPKMDGFELCEKIKFTLELSHIPIILLTAKNTLQARIQGLKVGADAYIEKPFSLDHLYAQIENLLAGRLKLKECYAKSPLVHINSIAHTKMDEAFVEQLVGVILKHLDETELDVERLSLLMNMSKPTLYRKIKSISDLSPHDIINLTRLKKAADLINSGNHRVNELAEETGYNSPGQFRRNFYKYFNMSPSEYIDKVTMRIHD